MRDLCEQRDTLPRVLVGTPEGRLVDPVVCLRE
jgi:hypothetical protein